MNILFFCNGKGRKSGLQSKSKCTCYTGLHKCPSFHGKEYLIEKDEIVDGRNNGEGGLAEPSANIYGLFEKETF